MAYLVRLAGPARKALRKQSDWRANERAAFADLILCLEQGEPPPARYQDHKLRGALSHMRECHIGFDRLVEYSKNDDLGLVVIARIGTHLELFGE